MCMHVCVYAYVCLCAHGRYFLAVDVGVTRAVLAHAVATETLETVCAYICVFVCVMREGGEREREMGKREREGEGEREREIGR